MFENLFKRKNNKRNKIEKIKTQKEFLVKDLYVTYPGVVSLNRSKEDTISFNQDNDDLEPIIVIKTGNRYVRNVLNGRKYGIYSKFLYDEVFECFLNQYMVGRLEPLELAINDKLKTTITREEIIDLLYPENNLDKDLEEEIEESNEEEIKDPVLQEILRVSNHLEENLVSEDEKERIRNELKDLGSYYINGLIELKSKKGKITLSFKNELDLKNECMRLLTEIEEKIPVDTHESSLRKQLTIFESKIGK